MSGPDQVVLRGTSIVKKFGDFVALDGVDFELHEREVVAVVGSSGSGKSTLVRCLGLLEEIDGGAIEYRGELLGSEVRKGRLVRVAEQVATRQRAHFGMVFQSFNLFPHMTALQNVLSGPRYAQGRRDAGTREKALALLETVGLSDKAHRYPSELSGGQQQRVAIARALALEPDVMFFDEPTSALDPELVREVLETIKALAEGGMTMVIVTHEMRFARSVADRLVYMDRGTIVESGDPATVMDHPTTDRARQFFSKVG